MPKEKKQGVLSDQVFSNIQRLHETLSLGLRNNGEQEMKWVCMDAGIESHALKKIDSFINCLTFSLSQNPLIKESISKIVTALTGILHSKNISTLNTTLEVISNMARIIRTNIREYPISNIISSLSNLLSLNQLSPVTKHSCITALNMILTNLGVSNQVKIGEILEKDNIIGFISIELQGFELYKIEYFVELVDLLRLIILRWPYVRFRVWSDKILMQKFEDNCDAKEIIISTNVLKLCSSIALCSHGAKKMLQNKLFINKIIKCMGKHNDISVRIQSFKLCRHLMKSREGFSMLINTHIDAIIKEIINAMSMFNSLNDPSIQMPLILEASRTSLVLISRTGSHHAKFLSKNIDIILLGIIFRKCGNNNNKQKLLYGVDKLAWDIFGYLGTYCEDNFEGQFRNLDNLLSCACSWAANAMGQRHTITTESLDLDEPVSRAILLLLLSPCNSLPRNSLQLHLKHYSNSPSRFILRFLSTLQSVTVPTRHTLTDLTNFVCLCFLPKYQTLILKNQGMEILMSFLKRRAESDILIGRERIANHLEFIYEGTGCCVDEDSVNDWEGSDLSLFYGLICLSKLLEISSCLPREDSSIFRSILNNEQFGEGPKSYCRYILNLCGLHGSQSGLSEKISKGFGMREFADVALLFNNGCSFDVHGAVLIARCPKLFPPNLEYPSKNNPKMVIKMSDRVDREALGKVLEYIYSGYIESDGFDDGLLRKIKLIAKNCGLVSLLETVNKERPRWGSCGPHFDLKGALGPAGYPFSDVILEAKSDAQMECVHNSCQLSTPHIHAHKIILCLNCDYWRALFQSGMNESFSSTIKVPIGYSALTKLTNLFYSGNIPKVNLDCKFKSLTEEEKSREVKAYVELSFLAEYWCLEGIADDALRSVLDCIVRNVVDERNCLRVIRFASELGQWRIVEGGIRELAPKYPKLRGMEWFEEVGDDLKEMLRVEYVKLM